MNQADLRRYAADPIAFVLDLTFPTRQGPRRFGDVATDFQLAWLDAMAPSFLAVANGEQPPTPKFWIEASKNCSKTTLVAALILWLLIFRRRPGNGVAGAVDKDNAAEVLLAARELLGENPHLGECIEIQAWAIVGKQTDCVVEIVATDRKGSQGGRPMLTYVDECSHVDDGSFEFVRNVLDDASKTGGLTIVTSNAGWTGTPAWELREIARTSELWTFLRWDQPSPLTPMSELKESRLRNSAARHARLHYTAWGPRDEGDALDPGDIEAACVLKGPAPFWDSRWLLTLAGFDGGLKRDRSALALVGIANEPDYPLELIATRSWKPTNGQTISLADVEFVIANLYQHFRVKEVAYDWWQMEGSAQRLKLQGVNMFAFEAVPKNLDEMARQTMWLFKERAVRLYPDPELLKDLSQLSIVDRGRSYRLSAPRTAAGHADLAFATCMALTRAAFARQWMIENNFIDQQRSEFEQRQQTEWIRSTHGYGVPLPDAYRHAGNQWDWSTARRIELPPRGGR